MITNEKSFRYGEAEFVIKFGRNNLVTISVETTRFHEFPLRKYRETLPLTDLVTWLGIRLPSQGTKSCRPVRVKGDLMMNIRTNAPPYINFGNKIILRLGDEAQDIVQYLNSTYIEKFLKGLHETKRKN